jgi:hypothetical protein
VLAHRNIGQQTSRQHCTEYSWARSSQRARLECNTACSMSGLLCSSASVCACADSQTAWCSWTIADWLNATKTHQLPVASSLQVTDARLVSNERRRGRELTDSDISVMGAKSHPTTPLCAHATQPNSSTVYHAQLEDGLDVLDVANGGESVFMSVIPFRETGMIVLLELVVTCYDGG